MKVLVTGSSGFIGYHLSKKLVSQGHEVIGVDDNNDYYNPALKFERLSKINSSKFSFYENDINNIELPEKDFDLAINLAAQAGVRVKKDKEHLFQSSNIEGFSSFCNFCEVNEINKIIYASSSSVYCDNKSEKFCESATKLFPKSMYGKSKLANELLATKLSESKKISFVGLRFFSVYGPFGRPDMAYYSFTKNLKDGKKICLYNEGNMYRDMTYIDDIIEGIMSAIDYVLCPKNIHKNEIFNLGNDKPIKTTYLLKKLEQLLNIRGEINYFKTGNESIRTHADITKAKNILGYEPKITFEDGIRNFVEWHKYYENF